jgi:hypothetical protein
MTKRTSIVFLFSNFQEINGFTKDFLTPIPSERRVKHLKTEQRCEF